MSIPSSSSFWIISIPANNNPKKAWEHLTTNIIGLDLCEAINFKIPYKNMKVGTLDTLMSLSDEIAKIDTFVEGVLKKCEKTLYDLVENPPSNLFFVENAKTTPMQYIQKFEWKEERYSSSLPLRDLSNRIFSECQLVDESLKQKVSRYFEVKNSLLSLDKKESSSLALRPLNDIVKPSALQFSSEKEYPMFIGILVVVPKARENEWLVGYESIDVNYLHEQKEREAERQPNNNEEENSPEELRKKREREAACNNVVPKSCLKLFEDEENILYRVFVMAKGEELFKTACKEKRFLIRSANFTSDEDTKVVKEKKEVLEADKNSQFGTLINWCKGSYSEVFISWVHVKAIRVFVESVLRFGLPVSFQAGFIAPKAGSEKTLRLTLADMYGHLSNAHLTAATDDEQDVSDFYPYVSLNFEFGLQHSD